MTDQSITSPRRFYLLKRQDAAELCDKGLELVWRAKQEAEPGTPLAADFPLLARLTADGYTTSEDLNGADECELIERGFSAREAQSILTAYAALT